MTIHTFGAYFGLAASFFVTPREAFDHPKATPSYASDLFSMIGTIFLWIYWPSFNGALAPDRSQYRVVINTILSLCGSTFITFVCSRLFRHGKKFELEDIQNATLSGGVAIGSSCDLVINPGGAILIGCIAGAVSTLGFNFLSPFLRKTIRLHDSCGINNLHGMPGIIGGFAGVVSAGIAIQRQNVYGVPYTLYFTRGSSQWGYQWAAICTSFGFGAVGGILFGALAAYIPEPFMPKAKHLFDDEDAYEIPAFNQEKSKFPMDIELANNHH